MKICPRMPPPTFRYGQFEGRSDSAPTLRSTTTPPLTLQLSSWLHVGRVGRLQVGMGSFSRCGDCGDDGGVVACHSFSPGGSAFCIGRTISLRPLSPPPGEARGR